MSVYTANLELDTRGDEDTLDITAFVGEALEGSGLKNGTVTVFIPGATGGVTTVEYEPGLLQDLKELWHRIAPRGPEYHHQAWHDGNGHSHVRASLLGPSLVVPFVDGQLVLGRWQQIVVVDFDIRPRKRRVVLQFLGEA